MTLTNTGRPLRPCGFKMVQTIQKMLVICVESFEILKKNVVVVVVIIIIIDTHIHMHYIRCIQCMVY